MRIFFLYCFILLLTGCGFHLQGETHLAPPLHHLYLQTGDPYGQLARDLQQNLRMSHVQLVSSPDQADTILVITQDSATQEFLNVSGTNQTRQYNLKITVTFAITDKKGHVIVGPQIMTESRPITVQSNQILGSSNEANLFYQQMRRTVASAMMNRLASKEITAMITAFYSQTNHHHS